MFDAPAPAAAATIDPDAPRWREENHLGALCVFQPLELLPSFETEYGVKPALRCTVTVVAGPGAGARYEDALVFGTVVIGQLRESTGRSVLARLIQGDKRPGKRPPWKLDGDVSNEDRELAVRAMTMLAGAPAAAPAQQPAAAAPAPQPATAAPKAPWE